MTTKFEAEEWTGEWDSARPDTTEPPRVKILHLFDLWTLIGACGDDEGPFAFGIRDVTCDKCRAAVPDPQESR